MKAILTVLALIGATTPSAAQLSAEAFTWGAEAHSAQPGIERTTVIAARKAGPYWSVEMLCEERRGRKVTTRRWQGQARWMSPGFMHAYFGGDLKASVVPKEDGSVGVMASAPICAQGPGYLTSGGG